MNEILTNISPSPILALIVVLPLILRTLLPFVCIFIGGKPYDRYLEVLKIAALNDVDGSGSCPRQERTKRFDFLKSILRRRK